MSETNMKTIDKLFISVLDNEFPSDDVLCDYFGKNTKRDIIQIIFGLYIGLIKFKQIGKKLIENSFKANRLDELIHKKYKYHGSGYYNQFCEKKIIIGNTNTVSNEQIDITFEIYDDDHCINCNMDGYITKNNYIEFNYDPHCGKCGITMCKICKKYNSKTYEYDRSNCSNCSNWIEPDMIMKKILSYNQQDMKKFGIKGNVTYDDVKLLLQKHDNKCYVCDDIVLLGDYSSKCLYQFTLDRIDNNRPHDKDNVLICCYFCNCRQWLNKSSLDIEITRQMLEHGEIINNTILSNRSTEVSKNIKYKMCINMCHTNKRCDIISRNDVSKEKIQKLKINLDSEKSK